MLDLLHVQFHAFDLIVTVETAVYAVVFTVVGNVERCKEIDGIAKMLARFQPRLLCHFFQERFGGRGEQRLEILNGAGGVLQRGFDVLCRVFTVIVIIHLRDDAFADVGFDLFHSGQVFHVVFAAGRIGFQTVFLLQRFGREFFRIDEKLVFHKIHLLIP